MHGLIFETSVWLLAESTRLQPSPYVWLRSHSTCYRLHLRRCYCFRLLQLIGSKLDNFSAAFAFFLLYRCAVKPKARVGMNPAAHFSSSGALCVRSRAPWLWLDVRAPRYRTTRFQQMLRLAKHLIDLLSCVGLFGSHAFSNRWPFTDCSLPLQRITYQLRL